MNAPESLVLDLVEWVAQKPKPMDVVLDAWRTSCPRLPVWEDAVDYGYVTRSYVDGEGVVVSVSTDGIDFMRSHGRMSAVAYEIPLSTDWPQNCFPGRATDNGLICR